MIRRLAQVGLALALVAVAFALRGRRPALSGKPATRTTPEGVVRALFEAASRGDDEAYLALTGGEFRASLLQSRRDLGRAAFRESLKRTTEGVKGLAMVREGSRPDGGLALQVELTFLDRNERQTVVLARRDGGWVVVWMGPARRVVPAVPYGAPAFE